jgi:gluconolactonase
MKALALTAILAFAMSASAAPRLADVLDPAATLERAATGFQFTEGPVWHPAGWLLFSDIPAGAIIRLKDGKTDVWRQPSGFSNGLVFDRQGRLIACQCDRQVTRTEADGRIVPIARRYEGKRLNTPNDAAVGKDGSVYFTDPPYGLDPRYLPNPEDRREELGFYGVYRVAKDGALTLLDRSMHRPNGIAFSPDFRRLYVNDSEQRIIRVWDVAKDGTLKNGRTLVAKPASGAPGTFDGLKVDAKGNLWTSAPGGVSVYTPSGELLGSIPVPEVTTNVAFGGKDGKTLFITAQKSVYAIRTRVRGAVR